MSVIGEPDLGTWSVFALKSLERQRDSALAEAAEARALLREAQSWFARTSFSGSEPEFVNRIANHLDSMTSEHPKTECVTSLPAGTYRVIDGKMYRVEPGLPPDIDIRAAEIDSLRGSVVALKERLKLVEAECDERRRHTNDADARAEAAEAEVARLREELRQSENDYSQDVFALNESVREAREAALREAAMECALYALELENRTVMERAHATSTGCDENAVYVCRDRILALAAPAAEGRE